MTKVEFLKALREKLSGLPQDEMEERLLFFSEMIDDRMEDGCTEDAAVRMIGTVEEIAAQILSNTPPPKVNAKPARTKHRLRAPEIVFLVLGFPLWFPLLAAAFAVVLSLYVVLWSLVASTWAVFASFSACFLSFVSAGIAFVTIGNGLTGVALIGSGLILAGLAIFSFFGCKAATQGTILLTRKIASKIHKCLVRKEAISCVNQ